MFIYISATARLVALSLSMLTTQNDSELAFRWKLADAIVSVTDNEHEQNVLMSIARWESNYIERLASPNCVCKGRECDNGRARGSWQIIPYNADEKSRLCVSLEQDAVLALARVQESEQACRGLPKQERLAIYTRGRCSSQEGRRLSRIRWVQ